MTSGSEKYIEVIKFCGMLYDFINENYFKNELVKPVITVLPDERDKAAGWFIAREVWKENGADKGETEINISANFLNRPPINIAETLLHQMCHQYAYANTVQECSRNGKYHNRIFKRIAETHGLTVQKVPASGYAQTELTEGSKKAIEKFLVDTGVSFIYRELTPKGAKIKSSSTRKYVCPSCDLSVRATKKVNIICADCNQFMQEDE